MKLASRSTIVILLAGGFAGINAQAQTFPSKPIRIVVSNAPGGGTDTVARIVGDRIGPALGATVIVDNRPGGGGRIACEIVARSPKDGHTLLLGSNTTLITAPALYSNLSYDPVKDFSGISLAATTSYILTAHPSVPVKSVKEMVNIAKTRKGSLTYGSTGPGSAAHLGMELLEAMTDAKLIHVPFKGSVPAMMSLTQGEIDVMFGNYQATLPLIRAGRLRSVGVTSLERSKLAPDIPTINESGLPGFEMEQFYSIAAPAGTPRDIIMRINQEMVKRLPGDDVKNRLAAEGIEIRTSTPEDLDRLVASQVAKWTKIIRRAGIKVE
jgi:tripartite-type tricarboxylate transporter receptor subunit TctC